MVPALPRPLVLCGPSGSGKSTLLKKMFQEFPDKLGFSVSHTTRKPREGEKDGEHYNFTDRETMEKDIKDGKFIEFAEYSGNLYGTSKAAVEAVQKQGKVCVLDIDLQGVRQILKTDLNPLCIFLKPPSLEELEKRLRARQTETEETLQARLKAAREEIEYGTKDGNFDCIIENNDLEYAYKQLREILVSRVLRRDDCSDK